MGIFSKIKKGFKKVVSKIGKGIKKTVKKVGKFMNKLGIVGQIGLALVLPGIGSMMGSLAGGLMTSSIGVVRGAGQLINAAVNIGTKTTSLFKSVTEGVGKVLGDVVGATLNRIPGAGNLLKGVTGGRIDITSKTFADAWKTTQNAISDVAGKGGDLFSMRTLTDPNKYITQAAASAGQAALAGAETPSTFDDSKLDFLDESQINIEAGTGLASPEAGQINLEAAGLSEPSSLLGPDLPVGPGSAPSLSTDLPFGPGSTPSPWLEPTVLPTGESLANEQLSALGIDPSIGTGRGPLQKARGSAIARQGAEAAAAATPAENLGMGEATFYSDAMETDPVKLGVEGTIQGRGTRKQISILEAVREARKAYDVQPPMMPEEAEGGGMGVVDIYGTTGIGRERMPLIFQQFEADPMLVQSYAYGASAAYNNYKQLMNARYPGMVS